MSVTTRCEVRAPLVPFQILQYAHTLRWLPILHEGRIFLREPEQAVATDERTGAVLWTNPDLDFPELIWRGRIVARRLRPITAGPYQGGYEALGLDLADPETGQIERTILQTDLVRMQPCERGLVATQLAERFGLCLVDYQSGELVWRWREAECEGRQTLAVADGAAVCGLVEGGIVALSSDTGRMLWHHSVADLSSEFSYGRPGALKRAPTHWQDLWICDVRKDSVVALSFAGGDRVWVWRSPGQIWEGQVYEGDYYVLYSATAVERGSRARLARLDAQSGRVVSDLDLMRTLPKSLRGVAPTSPLLVCAEHVFVGSNEGVVFAFDRERATYRWSHQPKGGYLTGHVGGGFAAVGGRLYYSDMTNRLYCLHEAPDGSAKRLRGGA